MYGCTRTSLVVRVAFESLRMLDLWRGDCNYPWQGFAMCSSTLLARVVGGLLGDLKRNYDLKNEGMRFLQNLTFVNAF